MLSYNISFLCDLEQLVHIKADLITRIEDVFDFALEVWLLFTLYGPLGTVDSLNLLRYTCV